MYMPNNTIKVLMRLDVDPEHPQNLTGQEEQKGDKSDVHFEQRNKTRENDKNLLKQSRGEECVCEIVELSPQCLRYAFETNMTHRGGRD